MKNQKLRNLIVTALLTAISYILMIFAFSIPALIPKFVEMDFSELPALIAAFSLGPVWGVAVCLVKNLLHLIVTTTGGVGELANFILGASFVFTAGVIYKHNKSIKGALVASLVGSFVMAAVSLPVNYFITYPFYSNFIMPMDDILGMYKQIIPSVDSLFKALLVFNVPFNFVFKGILNSVITFLVYKRLSPVIKGR